MSVRGDAEPNQLEPTRTKAEQNQTDLDTRRTTRKILDLIALNPYITGNKYHYDTGK